MDSDYSSGPESPTLSEQRRRLIARNEAALSGFGLGGNPIKLLLNENPPASKGPQEKRKVKHVDQPLRQSARLLEAQATMQRHTEDNVRTVNGIAGEEVRTQVFML
jgi:hypothetical protein